MPEAITWRVLVVEDDPTIGREIVDGLESAGWLDAQTAFEVQLIQSFDEGLRTLAKAKFDLLILDLKDDSKSTSVEDHERVKPGLDLLVAIKKIRFVPVVFYTGLPAQVTEFASPFVRVVEKTEGITRVREEIRAVIGTRLPELSRYLEEQQRQYFWDFVEKQWESLAGAEQGVDLAYLMARRLAAGLQGQFTLLAAQAIGAETASPATAHPMEFYIFPPVGERWKAGDILRRKGSTDYVVVLTPTCDFAQGKAAYFLTALCTPLTERAEYRAWCGTESPPAFGGNVGDVKNLMKDRVGDRFKFFPGTWGFPDLVVDLQQLASVPLGDQQNFDRIASMDSPYAETLLARFARFYGRIGTPDLDLGIAIERAKNRARAQVSGH